MTPSEGREFLLKAADAKRIAPAYLITGGEAEERRELAKFLAQALFCSERKAGSPPCSRCPACRKIIDEKHPDLFLIKGEGIMGFLSIEQVRQLKSEIYLSPYQAAYRIYLLEIEAIREEAANAFLKTLEEPPQTAILILLSQMEREFLPTILSRLTKIRLPEPEPAVTEMSDIKNIFALSWKEPAGIFRLAKEIADADESDLKRILKELVASLRIAMQFKEGMRSGEETPEIIQKMANRSKTPEEVRELLEETLAGRQDILRGRVARRFAMENLLISLSRPPSG